MSDDSSSPKFNFLTLILIAAVAALAFLQLRTMNALNADDKKISDMVRAEQQKTRDWVGGEVSKLRDTAAADTAAREKTLDEIRDEMDQARRQARGVAGRVKEDALKGVDDLASRIEANERKLREQQKAVASEFDGIRQTASNTQTNVAAVSTEVREVKADVANTRTQLDRTIADLRRATGDMGVMSGLIATNGKEIAALKEFGDRNYFEFTADKTKRAVQVGDVWLLLKKADVSRNRYTIEVQADDRKIEKRDRTANEPVQFYVGRDKQPHELVINQVRKDQVVGYLATPKAGLRP